jgi:hypothetical protein
MRRKKITRTQKLKIKEDSSGSVREDKPISVIIITTATRKTSLKMKIHYDGVRGWARDLTKTIYK